jgi:cobalt-zinc-cadmium efflux system protein
MSAGNAAHDQDPHGHDHAHERFAPTSALRFALILTVCVMLLELAGGWLSGSVALLADAGHMLTDSGALSIALMAAWIAARPRSPKMSFGYGRAEVLGALINGTLLGGVSVGIALESIRRLQMPREIDAPLMIAVACVGLAANGIAAWILARSARTNLNVRAAWLHVIGDGLGSIGAIAAGLSVWLLSWTRADAVAGLGIAGLLVIAAVRLIRDSVNVLLERVPAGMDLEAIAAEIRQAPGVRGVHDLHIWQVTPGFPAMSAHIDLADDADPEEVRRAAHRLLHKRYGIGHTTIQTERGPGLLEIQLPD